MDDLDKLLNDLTSLAVEPSPPAPTTLLNIKSTDHQESVTSSSLPIPNTETAATISTKRRISPIFPSKTRPVQPIPAPLPAANVPNTPSTSITGTTDVRLSSNSGAKDILSKQTETTTTDVLAAFDSAYASLDILKEDTTPLNSVSNPSAATSIKKPRSAFNKPVKKPLPVDLPSSTVPQSDSNDSTIDLDVINLSWNTNPLQTRTETKPVSQQQPSTEIEPPPPPPKLCTECLTSIDESVGFMQDDSGKYYHLDHFICQVSGCGKKLRGLPYVMKDDVRYCKDCFEKLCAPDYASLFAREPHCKEILSPTSFLIYNNNPYCKTHYYQIQDAIYAVFVDGVWKILVGRLALSQSLEVKIRNRIVRGVLGSCLARPGLKIKRGRIGDKKGSLS
ncbi:hypothetical protein HDU76_011500 [Blyttiomyces sp. JEL0837]|nr:hypothetical protein HDU76_011500 [Blyttiomyces sp. JEL0837]